MYCNKNVSRETLSLTKKLSNFTQLTFQHEASLITSLDQAKKEDKCLKVTFSQLFLGINAKRQIFITKKHFSVQLHGTRILVSCETFSAFLCSRAEIYILYYCHIFSHI